MKILPKVLVLMALALPAGAESLPVVTLSDAIAAASENNISLKQAAISMNQTIRNENNYVADYLPTFGLSATADTGWDFPDDGTAPEFNGFGLNLGAAASFSYTLSGSKITGAESRKLAKEGAALTYESAYDSVESLITSSYWTLSSYDVAIENAKASLEDAKASYESTLSMYNAGMVDELTLSNMELALSNAEMALTEAENDKSLAMASFKAATGLTDDFATEPLPETVMLSLPSPEELFREYAEGSSAIRSARNTLATAKNAETTATLTQYMPTVTATIGYTYAGGISSKDQMMEILGTPVTTQKAGEYSTSAHSLTGSVAVNIPLSSYIPGSTADEARRNASDAVQIAALSLQNEQNTLLDSIRQSVISINQQQATLGMLRQSLAIAERTYALAEDSYEAGLITADDLSDRRTSLLSAQNNLLTARLGHLLSSYTLADTLGIDLQELQDKYPSTEKETE